MRDEDDILSEAIIVDIIVMTDRDIHIDVSLNILIAVAGLATPCSIEGDEVDEIGDQRHWEAYRVQKHSKHPPGMLLLLVIEIVFVVLVIRVHSLLVAFLFSRIHEEEKEGQGSCDKSAEVIENRRTSHENVKVGDGDCYHQNQADDPKDLHHDEVFDAALITCNLRSRANGVEMLVCVTVAPIELH